MFKNLFKKITIIDYIWIGLFLTLGLTFFFFFLRKQAKVNIRVKVTDPDVLYAWTAPRSSYADRFVKGDVEKDALGRVVTEIINVEKFSVSSSTKAVYLDLAIDATFDKRAGLYYTKGKPLVYGSSFRFNFQQVLFDGIVTELPDTYRQTFYEYKNYEVKVLSAGISNYYTTEFIRPEAIRSVKKGDKMSDSNHNILAEVIDASFQPSIRIITSTNGEVYKVNDPLYIDGYYTLKVRAKVVGDEAFLLEDYPIRIGETIPFILNTVTKLNKYFLL